MSGKAICTCGHPWKDHGSDGTGDLTRCLYHHDVDRPCPCRVFVNRGFTQVHVNVEEFLKPDPNAPVIHGTRESPEAKHLFNIVYDPAAQAFADGDAPPEMVDHPAHYGGEEDPFEHIKVCEAKGWGYHIGNCTKYLWRLGLKDPSKTLEDAKKARWYLDRYIQTLERSWTKTE